MLRGAGYTVLFALAAMLGGLLIGFRWRCCGCCPTAAAWPASVYVSLMRGTPLLVQMFVIYYGLPSVGIEFTPVTAGILALSLNSGAFLSESLRGAIGAVSRAVGGQLQSGPGLLCHAVLRGAAAGAARCRAGHEQYADQPDQGYLAGVGHHADRADAVDQGSDCHHLPALPLYLAAAAIYWRSACCSKRCSGARNNA
jgi:cystine transport system permease protein